MRKILIVILLALLANIAFAQDKSNVKLTVPQASQLLRDHNPQLRSKALDVKDAEAQLRQSRSYDNPSVDGMYNIYNPPTTNGWTLDTTERRTYPSNNPLPLAVSTTSRCARRKVW